MGNVERADNVDNKQRLSHQDPTPLHLAVWFPDVTASDFFEVPAAASADAFGYCIFESYADEAVSI